MGYLAAVLDLKIVGRHFLFPNTFINVLVPGNPHKTPKSLVYPMRGLTQVPNVQHILPQCSMFQHPVSPHLSYMEAEILRIQGFW